MESIKRAFETSLCRRAYEAACAWCRKQFDRSAIAAWMCAQRTERGEGEKSAVSGLLSAVQRRVIRPVLTHPAVERTLDKSVFSLPTLWCGMTMVLLPLLPTMLVLVLSLGGYLSVALYCGRQREPTLLYAPYNKYIWLYGLCYAIATVTSAAGSSSWDVGLITVCFILFSMVLANGVHSWKALRTILLLMVAAGAVVSVIGFAQLLFSAAFTTSWVDEAMFDGITFRIYSTLENPNVLGTYLLLTIPFGLAVTIRAPGRRAKLPALAAVGVMAVCLVLTYSRGCYLGLLFAGALFLVLWNRRWIGVGVAALATCPLWLPSSILNRFTSIGNMADTSTSYRVSIWHGTVTMLKDYWFTGLGPGEEAFQTVFPFYAYSAVYAAHSHNLFLQIICEVGAIGFALFLILLVSYYRCMFTTLRRSADPDQQLLVIASVAAITGFLVEGMTDYTFYNYRVMLLFWAILGLSVLFTRIPELKAADGAADS